MTKTGILIVAHSPLSSALREAALHVFPEAGEKLLALDVQAQASAEQSLQKAKVLQAQLGTENILLFSDVMGATPCNVARRLASEPQTQISMKLIAGVNLPMLLRALNYQDEDLDEIVDRAIYGGTQGMVVVPT